MKKLCLVLMISCLCFGCGKPPAVEHEKIAITRLHNAYDSIALAIIASSNHMAGVNFNSFIANTANQNPIFKELLTKRTGGFASSLLLNTNISAWQIPTAHAGELAIICPDRINRDGQCVGIGIRFDRGIEYFTCVSP